MDVTPQDSSLLGDKKILLYYPTIDIPSPRWIRQGLMYWDQIGSIVPNSYDAHLPQNLRYSEQIQPLYDAKLFRPFEPGDLFNRGWQTHAADAFKSELLTTLDSDEFRSKLPQERRYETEVYVEKMNENLFEELLARKLVSPKRDETFIYFDEDAALVYMAILAKYLADIDEHYTVPSTDLREYEKLNFKANDDDDENSIIPALRIEFRDVLRVPADDVEIERVIDFDLNTSSSC